MTQSSDNPSVSGERNASKLTNITHRSARRSSAAAVASVHRPTSGGLAAQANGDGE